MSEPVICEICGREFKNNIGLVSHINKSEKLSSKEYYDLYLKKDNEEFCYECGKLCNFINIKEGYRDFCSLQCGTKSKKTREKIENTNLERYGEKHYFQTESGKEKIKDIVREKYGVEYAAQSDLIKEKMKITCKNKYGVDHPLKNDKVKEKGRKTNLERYGVEFSMQSPEIKNKRNKTNNLRYGGNAPANSKSVISKMQKTNIEKYGTKYVIFNEEIKNKKDKTCLEKYGNTEPLKNKDVRNKIKETTINRYGVDNVFKLDNIQKEILDKKKKSFFENIFNNERINDEYTPLFNLEDYNGVGCKYKWKHDICGNIFEDDIDNGSFPVCRKCYPFYTGSSKGELELYNFISEIYNGLIVQKNRTVLKNINKELDIYIPDKNLAIEYCGLYWHSQTNDKTKKYHLNKYLECKKQNINLITIFEDEWINKPEIIKSVIKNKLGLIENKIFARKCIIKEIDNNDARKFLNDNHIQGHINGKYYGLIYNNEIIQICGIGPNRYNKKYNWELLRVCPRINTVVVGGLSKLIDFISNIYTGSIITYSDLRYGDGNGYLNCGFDYSHTSEPNYYYFKTDKLFRYSRNKFQKHKLEKILENYNSELSEYKNMINNNYYRIWDCGNNVYIRK